MTEQELDLIQFAAREVAETRAGTPQVVRASLSISALWLRLSAVRLAPRFAELAILSVAAPTK